MRNLLLKFFLPILLFTQCSVFKSITSDEYYSEEDSTAYIELTDKCYERSIIEATYIKTEQWFAIYNGDIKKENVETKEIELILEPAKVVWFKKANENCHSINPDDCFTWCLKEQPPITEKLIILIDTTQSQNYYTESFEVNEIEGKGGFSEWEQVLCKQDMTEEFIINLQKKLLYEGYLDKIDYRLTRLSKTVLEALSSFQHDNDLPQGNITLKTLDLLKFSYIQHEN